MFQPSGFQVTVCNSYCFQVEQLEQEVSELQRALADKQEQENAMLQVLFYMVSLIFFPMVRNSLAKLKGY